MKSTRLAISWLVLSIVAAMAFAGAPGKEDAPGQQPPHGRVLYKLRAGADPAQLGALDAVVKGRGLAAIRRLKQLAIDVARVPEGQGAEEAVCAELVATGAVLFAEPDRLVPPVAVPNDPYYNPDVYQWQHKTINSPGAWDITTGSSTVLVAVCDTGISSGHPDLKDNLQLPGFNSVDNSTKTEPVYNHGTIVAGCIGAVGNNATGVAGVAWTVKILPIRITNRGNGSAYVSDAAEGIRYAADQGAKVVNLSYLMAGFSSIDDAAKYLRGKGGLLFVAAGNDGWDPGWPDFASFVAVGATDSSDTRASWSNYGTYIDCVAPGVSIYSTSGASGYGYASGTSFASPITAGVAALIYAVNPSFTPAEVENFILSTCKDLGTPGDDSIYGHGRVDAAAAIAAASGAQPNQPPVAVADAYSTAEDTKLTVAAPGVLGNDTDPENDPLTAVLVTSVSHGTLSLNANGSFTYTPALNFNGTDSFTYRANDGKANSNTVTVTLTVSPVNDPPIAKDDSATTDPDTPVIISVLANDTDPDGDPLSVASVSDPLHGTAVPNVTTVLYTPDPGYTGSDSFTYTISDGNGGTATATVTVTVALVGLPDIYGWITETGPTGSAVGGVTVTLTRQSGKKWVTVAKTVTSAEGYYSFPSLAVRKTYRVTPSLNGWTFTPTYRQVTISSSNDHVLADFTGTRN